VNCQRARLATDKYDADGGVRGVGGSQSSRSTAPRRTSCTRQKVEMPIGETTVIVNEYLRNNSKQLVS
jgi:hypothetical protein